MNKFRSLLLIIGCVVSHYSGYGISPISGPTHICTGSTVTLSDATTGGTWYSSTPSVATITNTSGVVTPNAVGTTTITYTVGDSSATVVITVSPTPSASISPLLVSICNGGNVTIATTTPSLNVLPAQSFEAGVPHVIGTPIAGWNCLGPNNSYLSQVTSATNPTVSAAESGGFFMEWNSFSATAGSNATIYSPPFSMVGMSGIVLSFWVYRDYGSVFTGPTYATEGFTVYLNNTPVTGGTSLGFVPRDAATPVSGAITGVSTPATSGWYNYTCAIPPTYGATNYILFYAYSANGDNCYLDNVTCSSSALSPLTWSPVTALYTDPGFTTPYTGTPKDTVYYHPTTVLTTTTNVITATNTVGLCSVSAASTVTVNGTPAPVTGPSNVCLSATITLHDATAGGTWSSSATGVATVSPTGVVSGISPGSSVISYANSCGAFVTTTVTVVSPPAAITGSIPFCSGTTITLSDMTTGGTWTSSNLAVVTAGSVSGIVTGLSAGTSHISYTLAAGCTSVITATVNAAAPALFTSPAAVGICNGGSVALASYESSVNLFPPQSFESGVPHLICTPVAGWSCLGPNNSYLSQASAGMAAAEDGTYFLKWNSLSAPSGDHAAIYSPAFSTLGGTGAVLSFWVYREYNPIYSGPAYAAEGFTVYLNNTAAVGGTLLGFVPRDRLTATSGTLTGVSAPTANGWYNYTCSLPVTYGATNYILFYAYSDDGDDCYLDNVTCVSSGAMVPLAAAWSPTSDLYADAGLSIPYTGSLADTVYYSPALVAATTTNVITATNTIGACTATDSSAVTVNIATTPILGPVTICLGSAVHLSDSIIGGTWSSSNIAVATIDSATGLVSPVASGTATITYTDPCGGLVTTPFSVIFAPPAITGPSAVCIGSDISLSDASAGGAWSSSSPDIATVGSGGIVTGMSGGTATITYSLLAGCTPTRVVTVSPSPSAITVTPASAVICSDETIAIIVTPYQDLFPAQNFESGVPTVVGTSVAGWNCLGPNNTYLSTVNSATTPVAAAAESGSYFMQWNSYNAPAGYNATIYSPEFSLAGITGAKLSFWVYRDASFTTSGADAFTVYINDTPAIGGITLGRVPRSSSTAVSGILSGVSMPFASGWYQYTCLLPATYSATSYILFYAYSGNGGNCYLDNITCNYPISTSVDWSPVSGLYTDSAHTMTYLGTPTDTIYYHPATITVTTTNVITASNIGLGCAATALATVTVNPAPAPVSGIDSFCAGSSVTLTDASAGGIWQSSNVSVAAISTSGVVTGVSPGTAEISYILASCSFVITETINEVPSVAISPTSANICNGGSLIVTSLSGYDIFPPQSFEIGVPTVVGASVAGWNCLGPDNSYLSQVSSGSFPFASAEDSTYFMQWDSKDAPPSSSAAICSPLFNMVGMSGAVLSFWVYRQSGGLYAGAAYATEGFTVYLNNTPAVGGMVLGFVPREASTPITGSLSGAVTPTVSGWYNYTCTVPATYGTSNYILFKAYSDEGRNCYLDNITCKYSSSLPTSWSPATGLYTDPGFSTSYTGGSADTIYYHPTTITATTTHTITATSTSHGCTASSASIVTVNIFPSAGTIAGATEICADSTTNLTDAVAGGTWRSVDNSIATVAGGDVSGVTQGTDTIYYVVTNVCGSDTAHFTITVDLCSTGITIPKADRPEIDIYPNPVSKKLNITSSENITEVVINNLLGQLVSKQKTNSKTVYIDVSELAPGVYLIKVNDIETMKFVKE